MLAWFGIFGIGPALAFVLRRQIVSPAPQRVTPGLSIVLRFCVVYGGISILITPLLGASADRLVAYGWPFYFVALPWFVFRANVKLGAQRSVVILLLHLLTCWLAWFGFRQQTPGFLFAGLTVLVLNGLCYGLVKRSYSPC